jgi:hypothetical protein
MSLALQEEDNGVGAVTSCSTIKSSLSELSAGDADAGDASKGGTRLRVTNDAMLDD